MTNLPNDTRLKDFMAEVRELGRDAAQGKDALPNLAMKTTIAARDGLISTEKDADGNDSADLIYGEYRESESKKAKHEHTEGGIKGNTAKLRSFINLGMLPNIDGAEVLERAVKIRHEQKAKKEKVKSAYEALLDISRKQLDPVNVDEPLTDEVITEVIRKKPGKVTTAQERLAKVYEELSALNDEKELEGARSYIQDAAEMVRDGLLSIDAEVPPITKEEKELAALMAKMSRLGAVAKEAAAAQLQRQLDLAQAAE